MNLKLNSQILWRSLWICLGLGLNPVSAPVFAANKCTDSSGKVSFQDLPCASDETSKTIPEQNRRQQLKIPDGDWSLSFEAPVMTKIDEANDAGHYQYFASASTGLVMSVFVEPSEGKGTDKRSCGDYYWRLTAENPSIIGSTVDRIDGSDFIIVSYGIEVPDGESWMVQGNYNIYGYRDKRCIDIHISKLFPDDSEIDFAEFIRFASTLRFLSR